MIKCAIIGGSGYIGGELIRFLSRHPKVDLTAITANEMAGKEISQVHPNMFGFNKKFNTLTDINDAEVLFLALPPGKSMEIMQQFPNKKIIDTSADFRLKNKEDYVQYYKLEHTDFSKTDLFTYGLPELFRDEIKKAKNIASPGCFATAAILSVYPLVAASMAGSIVINGVTGSSGSGVKLSEKTHHPFRDNSFFAYEIFSHRHFPEIKAALHDKTGEEIEFIFQPHSGAFIRGIYITAVVHLKKNLSTEMLKNIYQDAYATEPFIRLREQVANIKWVLNTNFCDISVFSNGKTAIVTAAIDNLLKGGATQAIQSFNVNHGLTENMALDFISSNP